MAWKETLLSLASGAATALAMPGFGVFPLIFVSLTPLLYALKEHGGFWPGLLFGIAFFSIDLRWILTLMRFQPIVLGGYALLIAYLALGCGLLGAVLTWRGQARTTTWLLLAPALFVLLEYLRTLGPLGMGFSSLYLSLYRVPELIQSASLFGPLFLTAILVAVNGGVLLLFQRRKLRYALLAGGCVLALAAFNPLPPALPKGHETRKVAVVSSQVRQEEKLDARNLADLTDRYLGLGDQALKTNPDLIVFPESILPAYILQNESLKNSFADLARRGQTQILLGTGVYENRNIYNTVALLSPAGEVEGMFRMVRPVPFGEFIPGRRLWERLGLGSWMRSFLPLDLSRGDGYAPLDGWGTPICFESTFTEPSRRLTVNGAQALITVTNDAWFAGSSELITHFSCAVFRAVENRRWVVQSANGGISGIVDPSGRVVDTLSTEGVLTGDIELRTGLSLYARWGDRVMLILAGAYVTGCFSRRWRKKERGGEIRDLAP
jgi:apolipoprotein N-acyltransferase